jgi:hypothetical protein
VARRRAQARDENGEHQARQADGEEGRPPAFHAAGSARQGKTDRVPVGQQQAAEHQGEGAAEVGADQIGAQHGRAVPRREIVGQQRVGAGIGRRFPDADPDTRRRQVGETHSEAGRRRHGRPEGQARRHQLGAAEGVGDPPHGDADDAVEHREGRTEDEPQIGVGELQVLRDRMRQDRDDLPVDIVEEVRHHEHAEGVIGVGWGLLRHAAHERRSLGRGCLWRRCMINHKSSRAVFGGRRTIRPAAPVNIRTGPDQRGQSLLRCAG